MTAEGNQEVGVDDFNERVDIVPGQSDIFSTSQRIAMAQEMMSLVGSNPEDPWP